MNNFSRQLANLQQSVSRAKQQQQQQQSQPSHHDVASSGNQHPSAETTTTNNANNAGDSFRSHGHNHTHSVSHKYSPYPSFRKRNHPNHHHYHDNRSSTTPYPSQSSSRSRSRSTSGTHAIHHHRRRQQWTAAEEEEERFLPQLVQAIPKYHPLPVLLQKEPKKQRHVCLLFLTIDDLPLEHLWKAFLDSRTRTCNPSDLIVSIICHAKYPEKVQSPWLKKRLMTLKPSLRDMQQYKERYYDGHKDESWMLSGASSCLPPVRYFSRRPEWGSIEITRAMMDLLEEGLRIGTSRDNIDAVSKHIQCPLQASEYRERYSSQRYVVSSPDSGTTMRIATIGGETTLPTVDRFLFVSETCLPVVTMEEFEVSLFGDVDVGRGRSVEEDEEAHSSFSQYKGEHANQSWVHARNTPNNGYARQLQWDAMDPAIPSANIWKADQWMLLTRHHAWPILSLVEEAVQKVQMDAGWQTVHNSSSNHSSSNSKRDGRSSTDKCRLGLWQCFRKVRASDEMYFPTVMSLLGILKNDCSHKEEDSGKESNVQQVEENTECHTSLSSSSSSSLVHNQEVCRKRLTYCDWSTNSKNPEMFVIRREDNFKELKHVIKVAREEGCLFARKFTWAPSAEVFVSENVQKSNDNQQSRLTGEEWFQIVTSIK